MKRVMMFTCAVFCAVGMMAQDKEDLFQQCLVKENSGYLAVAKQLLEQPDAKNWVATRMERTESPEEWYIASILLARIEQPDVFREFQEFWTDICLKYGADLRRGQISGYTVAFSKKGPERRYVQEAVRDEQGKIVYGEEKETLNRPRIIKSFTPKRKTVEKYTEAEVQAGIARNTAVRKAILERALKFMCQESVLVQEELLSMVGTLWTDSNIKRHKDDPSIADIVFRKTADDERLSLSIRFNALSRFATKGGRQEAVNFTLVMLVDARLGEKNNPEHYGAIFSACSLLQYLGTGDDLAKLKALHPKEEWRQKILWETIQKLEERLEKERTGELVPLDIPR